MPNCDGDEAGLVVLMNGTHHYEIAVKQIEGSPYLIVRRQIGSLVAIVARYPLKSYSATLAITADRDWYKFSYAENNETPTDIAYGETRYLSTEVAGGFIGVYLGLYALAESPNCGAAFFDYFAYQSN